MTRRDGDYIQTFTGTKFWPLDPAIEDIHIEDIAHALSNTCRYTGHSTRFYSVAEHSCLMSLIIPAPHKLAALLHDASEAYLCDIARPVKKMLIGYEEAEGRVLAAIFKKFGLTYPLHEVVKDYDTRMLVTEAPQLLKEHAWVAKYSVKSFGLPLGFWTPETAELQFLRIFHQLTREVTYAT